MIPITTHIITVTGPVIIVMSLATGTTTEMTIDMKGAVEMKTAEEVGTMVTADEAIAMKVAEAVAAG